MRIRVTLPMPPSDNGLYWNMPKGGRTLTSAGKKFRNETKAQISELILGSDTDGADFEHDIPYELLLFVYFKEVENKTWGQKRGAQSRYKKQDVSNRQKLVTDAVMAAIGVDDRHLMRVVLNKREDADDPRVVVIVREIEEAQDG